MKEKHAIWRSASWMAQPFFLALVAIGAIACDDRESYPLPTNPLFNPAMMKELLLSAKLEDPQFHGGYQIEAQQSLDEPYACRRLQTEAVDIFWTLRTPGSAGLQAEAAVIFTIFPSNEAARHAWSQSKGTMPCDFYSRSSKPIEFLPTDWLDGRKAPCPARLTEGSIHAGARFGFSNGQAIMGNMIVQSQTISTRGYVENHADADTTVTLLHGVEAYIAELLQFQQRTGTRPVQGFIWPFSFVPCS